MNALRQLLQTLADVEGVVGSFVLSDSGGLLATDLPATFDAAAFAEAGPRIIRLADLGGSYGEQTRFFVIRFAEYKLYVRVLPGAFLGVLIMPSTSLPALKAAAGVVARRAESLLAAPAEPVPDTAVSPPRFGSEPPPRLGSEPPPRFGSEPPPRFVLDTHQPPPGPPPLPARGGSALGAPAALTNTLPSMTSPEPELTSSDGAPRRSIRFRGRSL